MTLVKSIHMREQYNTELYITAFIIVSCNPETDPTRLDYRVGSDSKEKTQKFWFGVYKCFGFLKDSSMIIFLAERYQAYASRHWRIAMKIYRIFMFILQFSSSLVCVSLKRA